MSVEMKKLILPDQNGNEQEFELVDALVRSNFVTPEMFGAKGNGSTDDSAAWQSAINTGKTVFANGVYSVEQPIYLISNSVICGEYTIYDNVGASDYLGVFNMIDVSDIQIIGGKISSTKEASTIAYKSEINASDSENISIRDIVLENANGTYGMRFSHCDSVTVEKCVVDGFNNSGISNVNSGNNFTVQDCCIYDVNTHDPNTYGIVLNGYENEVTDETPMGKNLKAIGNYIRYENPWWEAIDAHGGENVIVKNNFLENVHDGIAVYDDPVRHFTLKNCLIDSNIIICATTGDTAASGHFAMNTGGDNISVCNNIIVNGGNRGTHKISGSLLLKNARSCKVYNNQIYNSKSNGIYIVNADLLVIENNIISSVSAFGGDAFIIQFGNGSYYDVLIENNRFEDSLYDFMFPVATNNTYDMYFKLKNNTVKDVGEGFRMNVSTPDKYKTYTQRGRVGDIIINSNPSSGSPLGWICIIGSNADDGAAMFTPLANL